MWRGVSASGRSRMGLVLVGIVACAAFLGAFWLSGGSASAAPAWDVRAVSLGVAGADVSQVTSDAVLFTAAAPEGAVSAAYLYDITADSVTRLSPVGQDVQWLRCGPLMDGDHIVWAARVGAVKQVFLYDLATHVLTPLTSGLVESRSPHISGDRVVYSMGVDYASEVYAYTISTGRTQRLTDNALCDGRDGYLDIDGDIAVWDTATPTEDLPAGDSEIRVHNFATGVTTGVSSAGWDAFPQVSGTTVVWLDSNDPGMLGKDFLYQYNTVSRTAERVPGSVPQQKGMIYWEAFEGRVVSPEGIVWEEGVASQNDIGLHLYRPGAAGDELLAPRGDATAPYIADGLVAYLVGDGAGYQTYVRDIASGVTAKLSSVPTDAGVTLPSPACGEGVVAWGATTGPATGTLYVAVSDVGPPPGGRIFEDVSGTHPYVQAIEGLFTLGIVEGKRVEGSKRWFAPDDAVNRAQFAKMVVGTLAVPMDPSASAPFADLGDDPPGDPYPHQFVAAAALYGITQGITPTTYGPWLPVKRAQVVTMLVRGASTLRSGVLVAPPADYQLTVQGFDSPDHAANLRYAEYNGILAGLVGYGPAWNPWEPATRGEVAQMMFNFIQLVGLTP